MLTNINKTRTDIDNLVQDVVVWEQLQSIFLLKLYV